MTPENTLESLFDLVARMRDEDWPHRKRGAFLREATPQVAGRHLVEESVEFAMGAAGNDHIDNLKEELCDVLGVLVHAACLCDLDAAMLVAGTKQLLQEKFIRPELEEKDGVIYWTQDEPPTADRLEAWLLMSVASDTITAEEIQAEIAKWDDTKKKQVAEWSVAVQYSASDNDDVVVPPRPCFLPNHW